MLDHSCQVQRHPHIERGADCYETPPVAVQALLRVKDLPQNIWEPACGPGSIVGVLDAAGFKVHASDLYDYGCGESGVDFLIADPPEFPFEAIVTNPPFMHAQAFVERALDLSPLVVMLLRLVFYESTRRQHILVDCGLASIYVFSRRLPMMHRKDWEGRKANSSMAFAWFVYDRNYVGPTTIHRIDWKNVCS